MSENEQTIEEQNGPVGEGAAAQIPVGSLDSPPVIAEEEAEKVEQAAAEGDGGQPEKSLEETLENDPPPDDETLNVEDFAREDQLIVDTFVGDAAVAEEPKPQIAVSGDGLPLWKCHKTVAAFKITDIESMSNGQVRLIGEADLAFVCDAAYVDKHRPQIGGYFVRYHDGYRSWSPAEAFEDGYTPEDLDGYDDSA